MSCLPRTLYTVTGLTVLMVLSLSVCQANDLSPAVTAGPAWDGFTQENGSGLYHDIMAEIFPPLGIAVRHEYTNANRGIHLVNKGLADIYMCRSDTEGFPRLRLARYPMYLGYFYAIFKRDRIPDWEGPEDLKDRKVVWRRGYYRAREFSSRFDILEADSGETALAQVILGRADFYIDDLNLIEESISRTQIPMNKRDYEIRPVGYRSYRPVFLNSHRGERLMSIFEQGILKLHKSGRLKEIFARWNHPYPSDQFK